MSDEAEQRALMGTPEARESLRWFRSIATPFEAALEPLVDSDGSMSLGWQHGNIEFTADFGADGSLLMRAEDLGPEWDEWSELVQTPGPASEPLVRAFYMWPGGSSSSPGSTP